MKILRRKGRNSTSMKTLRETEDVACTCIRKLFAFPNMVLREIKIDEHLTRVTRFNPLWVSAQGQYH